MADESERSRFRIGYALAPKKVDSVILPSLIAAAKDRGLDLIPIDPSLPLSHQGHFDCIAHKLYDPRWKEQLRLYSSTANPHFIVIDPHPAIERLHNRLTMLHPVTQIPPPPHFTTTQSSSCSIPKQRLLLFPHHSDSPADSIVNNDIDLTFPLIAKPLIANGSLTSHQMSLLLNNDGLSALLLQLHHHQETTSIVLQEFVNHGGVIFKVYVAGQHIKCVKRKSLPDILPDSSPSLPPIMSFSQISNLAAATSGILTEENKRGDELDAEMPPSDFVDHVAKGLRQALGLNLFNFDMIRDSRDANRYLVIDINYFPGYAKLPSYEKFLTDFFCDVATAHHKKMENLLEE